MSGQTPVHIGLMGHIDHGKTELARALSEKVSTAGLDKHPQSKERGITIDLGFTMFNLHDYMVTLVDSPGHADLIRSVVAGANIIDAAILIVAADEGPKIQTGEHLIVLKSFGIETIIVTITKCDLVGDAQIAKVEALMRSILSSMQLTNVDFVRVSAKTGEGIENLKETIYKSVKPKSRDTDSPFLMPIDHAFPKKGHGTVVTGTILQGVVQSGEMIQTIPLQRELRVKSIQVFGAQRERAVAGDRVGINIPDIKSQELGRGDYLCRTGVLEKTDALLCKIEKNPLYNDAITNRMILNATIGMPTVTSQIIPYMVQDGKMIVLERCNEALFHAALLLPKKIGGSVGMKVLLMRTDLPPTAMRIVGAGYLTEMVEKVHVYRKKTRHGKVSRIREEDVLIEGLAYKKDIASRLEGERVSTVKGNIGKITGTFGTRGVVSAKFEVPVSVDDDVIYERLIEEEYGFGH